MCLSQVSLTITLIIIYTVRLQTEYGLDNFSDDVLLKVFSHLDALSLCNCVLVSFNVHVYVR